MLVDSILTTMLDTLEHVNEEDDFDAEFLRATEYAIARTRNLLLKSYVGMDGAYPYGSVYPDGYGGIRVEWSVGHYKRNVTLCVVKGNDVEGKEYLWHGRDEEHGLTYQVSPAILANRLHWLQGKEEICPQ